MGTHDEGQTFNTTKRKGGLGENSVETKETSQIDVPDAQVIIVQRQILPISETDSIAVGSASEVNHDPKNDKAGDCGDLDQTEEEFDFTKVLYADHVGDDNECNHSHDVPRKVFVVRVPVLEQDGGSGDLDGG